MKKVIIGLIGTAKSGRTTVAKMLEEKGFHFVSINEKVAEFAGHLFSEEELRREGNTIINKVRERGASVNKEYWLNLILVSVPDTAKYVVFDDISLDEVDNDKITAYQIYRPDVSSERLEDIETIENNGTIADLSSKVEDIYKKFTSSK
jgi:dephospho-CoA kinase